MGFVQGQLQNPSFKKSSGIFLPRKKSQFKKAIFTWSISSNYKIRLNFVKIESVKRTSVREIKRKKETKTNFSISFFFHCVKISCFFRIGINEVGKSENWRCDPVNHHGEELNLSGSYNQIKSNTSDLCNKKNFPSFLRCSHWTTRRICILFRILV